MKTHIIYSSNTSQTLHSTAKVKRNKHKSEYPLCNVWRGWKTEEDSNNEALPAPGDK